MPLKKMCAYSNSMGLHLRPLKNIMSRRVETNIAKPSFTKAVCRHSGIFNKDWGLAAVVGKTLCEHVYVAAMKSNGSTQGPVRWEDASCDIGAFPEFKFLRVEAILRSWRLAAVLSRLNKEGIKGATVSNVRGVGVQSGFPERHKGSEFGEEDLVEKAKLDIVCERSQARDVISFIVEEAHTGEMGDGKIFVHPVLEVVRIRTGECGLQAERMEGGRSDSNLA